MDEAQIIAKRVATDSGYDVNGYSVTSESWKNGWRFYYRRQKLGPYDGGDNHFTVLVKNDRNAIVVGGM